MKITEKIKTFEDACEALGVTPSIPNFDAIPERHQKALLAHYQLVIIAEALNEGWKPNWDNDDEWKYYPWFDMEGSSSGFSYHGYDYGYSSSVVGSRLCFKSRDLVEYAGKQFADLYKEYFVLN